MNRRLVVVATVVGLVAAAAAVLGLGVRSTFGGQAAVDEPQYLLSALSLWQDGDLDISNQLAAHAERPFHAAELPVQTDVLPDGRQVSPHDPLLPVLLAVPMGLGGWVAAKATLAVLAGLLAGLTTLVAVSRFRVSLPVAAVVAGIAGTSAPLVVYGQQVYPELVAALAVVTAVGALTGHLRRGGAAVLVLAVVALPWLSVKYAPVAATLAALGLVRLWREGRSRLAGAVVAALGLAAVAFAAVHQVLYGGWTAYASGDHFRSTGELGVVGVAPDYLGRSTRLVGLLLDRDFGLAAWQPAWLLLVPAVAALLHARPRHWKVLALPLAAGWLTATFVALTMHGFWWPGRQVVVVLPLAVLAVAVWVGSLVGAARRIVVVAGAVLAAGGALAYAWLLFAGWAVGGRVPQLTWVSAPDLDAGAGHAALRGLLPDYRVDAAGTWQRHAAWLVVITALAVAGWCSVARSRRLVAAAPADSRPTHPTPAQPSLTPPTLTPSTVSTDHRTRGHLV